MAEQTQKREGFTFRKWYEEHGDDLNAKRRDRYASDPEYREKAKAQARIARERRRARGGQVSETTVKRVIDGKEVELYRVSAAAEMIGKSPDTIRLWTRKGYVPGEAGEHRLYSLKQVKLLQKLAKVIDKYRYNRKYKHILNQAVKHIHNNW